MPSFGALREAARAAASKEKKLRTMTINLPDERRAEISVEHEHSSPHPSEQFRFAANENEALAAHLSKHLGIKLPGKAAGAGESGESKVSKSDFE